jgi:hypothetical protein
MSIVSLGPSSGGGVPLDVENRKAIFRYSVDRRVGGTVTQLGYVRPLAAIVDEVMLHEGGAKLAAYAEGKVLGKVKGAAETAPS